MADALVETSEQGHAYIKQFGITCSSIRSTNLCYWLISRISIIFHAQNRPVALWIGDLSHSKVYEEPLSYAEGSPLIYAISPIEH